MQISIQRRRRATGRILLLFFAIAGLTGWLIDDAGAQDAPREAIAIVVHPSVEMDDLPFFQLRKIFLGERQYWPNREKIKLLVRAPVAYERDLVLERIYQMDDNQFNRYWKAKIFQAEVTAGPMIIFSSDKAIELVSLIPGSITFVRETDVGQGVKVLRVDGKLPGEEGYPLQ